MRTDLLLAESVKTQTHLGMGTVMAHTIYGNNAAECAAAVCREIAQLEALFSRFIPESDISRINHSDGIRSEKIDPLTLDLLSRSLEISRLSCGSFDVTIAPLVDLWRESYSSTARIDESRIRAALDLVNYRDLELDPVEGSAGLKRVGQSIDLGGIGKGYAGDRIRDIFKQYDVVSAYSNLGGNVIARGAKPDGSAWQIGIQHPRREGALIGAVSVVDQAVVTSGDYQRFTIDKQGRRCHHILDLGTGYPSTSGLIGVSLVADSSFLADALSTVVFNLGLEEGMRLLADFPGTEAVLVSSDLKVFITQGLESRFQSAEQIEVNKFSK